MRSLLALALIAGCHGHTGAAPADGSGDDAPPPGDAAPTGRQIKVMIIDMFVLEGSSFGALGLTQHLTVNGVDVHCNADDVCEIVTGMGYANAASSVMALVLGPQLDLSKTYFVIAGIAGVDPAQGTLGSAAWARYAIDFGYANELDAREMPAGWPYGYFGIGTTLPSDPPAPDYRGTFHLDDTLAHAAFALSKDVVLEDSADAATSRAHYPDAPANQAPTVLQCDVVSSDTWFAGTALAQRARDWTKLATQNDGTFCMSAQEDNATLEVLTRVAAAGKLDFHRVALLRTGSDFGAPYPGQTDADGLTMSLAAGGLGLSLDNLAKAAMPLITAIVTDWTTWQSGVPPE